jgi:HAD superfamily hydrolase (TIGR01549 family)
MWNIEVGGNMNPIKLVLFDLDDTLVHFDDYWEKSVKEALRDHFFTKDMNANELFEVFKRVDNALVQQLDSLQISLDEYRVKRFLYSMEQIGKTTDSETALDFEQLYQSKAKSNMKPNMAVNKLITELNSRYLIGVLTNGSRSWQLHKLEAIGLHGVFPNEHVFISGEIGYEKPLPGIYNHVIRIVSLQPDQVLVIGDSWLNDVSGPIQQGMQAIWFNKKKKQIPSGPRPLAVINQLEELRDILLV